MFKYISHSFIHVLANCWAPFYRKIALPMAMQCFPISLDKDPKNTTHKRLGNSIYQYKWSMINIYEIVKFKNNNA